MTDNLRGALWMVLAMTGFAVEDVVFKMAIGAGGVSPGMATLLFGLSAMAISTGIVRRQGEPLWHRAYLQRRLMMRTGFEVMGRLFFALSLAFNTLSLTSSILQAAPLVVMLGAALVLGERIGPRRWIAMGLGLIGVLLILRPTPEHFSPTAIFAVLGMLGFALRDLATRTSPPEVHAAQLGLLGFAVVTAAGLILLVVEGGTPRLPGTTGALWIGATAIAGVIGYSALTAAMRTGEVSVVAPVRYVRLLVALILAFVLFGERPDATTLAGAGLVVGSGLWTLWRDGRRRRP